jgi:hypothetical protein
LGLKRKNAAEFAKKTLKLAPDKRLTTEQVQHMTWAELTELYKDNLSQTYYDAMAAGMTSREAKKFVSTHWFGSP